MPLPVTTEPIIDYHGQKVDLKLICNLLEEVGVRAGDDICVHSSLVKLGRPLVNAEVLLGTIVAALREVIGEKGTLLMPTFTYSYCENKVYDVRNSKSTMGMLTEYYRHLPDVERTLDPIFSFAVSGYHQAEYLACPYDSCFGPNCVYARLKQNQGRIVIFGSDMTGYTFLHYVEEQERAPYRYFKTFTGTTIDYSGKSQQTSIEYYVRKLEIPSILVDSNEILLERNMMTRVPMGGGYLCSMTCCDFYEVIKDMLQHDCQAHLSNTIPRWF